MRIEIYFSDEWKEGLDCMDERIHVCYAVSDPQGSYSKFAGTSICSLLEHTDSKVTLHLLYDDTLSEENRKRFLTLTAAYGQEIRFYNAPKLAEDTWEKAEEIFAEAMSSRRYTPANMYRLLLPEVLPAEIDKVIYLDGDTVFNMDVSELWSETVNSGLGAVSDQELLAHYGKQAGEDKNVSYLYETGHVGLAGVFNAGVLVFRLDLMRERENLLLEGVRFLADHAGQYKYYDNDILIQFFAETYTHLPWYCNIRLNWDMEFGPDTLVPGIYHFLGRNYSLEGRDSRHRLFLEYFRKTPWFDRKILLRACQMAQGFAVSLAQERLRAVRSIYQLCSRKQRVFVGLAADEARLREDFELNAEEPFLALAPGDQLRLPWPVETHVYVFFWSDYQGIKNLMEQAGYLEYEHFVDGTKLMPEQTGDLLVNDLTWIWNL